MTATASIEDFATNGFAGPFDLSDPGLAASVSDIAHGSFEFNEARGGLQDKHFVSPYAKRPLLSANTHLKHAVVRELANDKAIVAALRQSMGPTVMLRRSQFWRKPPNARPVMWHQDTHKHRGLGLIDEFSAWVALEDATIDNGCVWFLKESVREGIIDPKSFLDFRFQAKFYNSESLVVPDGLTQFEAVPMEMKAGQFVLFNQLCFHASGPNKTDGERIGLAFRYIPGSRIDGIEDELVEMA